MTFRQTYHSGLWSGQLGDAQLLSDKRSLAPIAWVG